MLILNRNIDSAKKVLEAVKKEQLAVLEKKSDLRHRLMMRRSMPPGTKHDCANDELCDSCIRHRTIRLQQECLILQRMPEEERQNVVFVDLYCLSKHECRFCSQKDDCEVLIINITSRKEQEGAQV